MPYSFKLLLIVLLFIRIGNLDACCRWFQRANEDDDSRKSSSLATREYSLSTASTSSEGKDPPRHASVIKQRNTSHVFDVCDEMFSQEVINVQEPILRSRYQFNTESAQCFMYLKGFFNDFSYEGLLEKTKAVRAYALKYLNDREDFFPTDYTEDSRKNLVYALQVLLQKRYALLNYCMNVVRDQSTTTSEFFLDFSTKDSITKKFPECLTTFIARNPATRMSESLKQHLLKSGTWLTIMGAFGSYSEKSGCIGSLRRLLERL